jgi:hypothetical protein
MGDSNQAEGPQLDAGMPEWVAATTADVGSQLLEGLKGLLNQVNEQVYIFIGKGLGLPTHKDSTCHTHPTHGPLIPPSCACAHAV